MTDSHRTARERYQAAWNTPRDRFGRAVLPRITEHPPRPGDVHPLERRTLLKLLPAVPLRFLHGLNGIELRARESEDFGNPFGSYQPHFKLVRLYSTPYPEWPYRSDVLNPNSILGQCGASLLRRGGQGFLLWPSRVAIARYYFARILAHELGHHHVYQYKHKRRIPGSSRGHEGRADALAHEIHGLLRFDVVFGEDAQLFPAD
jgi:hypothetical protein